MRKLIENKAIAIALSAVIATGSLGTVIYLQNDTTQVKQDNGYYSMTGMDKSSFNKEKTPVSNMLILLKILNNSSQCDGQWYQEVENFIEMLDAQYRCNKDSQDDFTNELMKLQCQLIKDLKLMYSEMCEENINKVQETYNKYHNVYYSVYNGGELSES